VVETRQYVLLRFRAEHTYSTPVPNETLRSPPPAGLPVAAGSPSNALMDCRSSLMRSPGSRWTPLRQDVAGGPCVADHLRARLRRPAKFSNRTSRTTSRDTPTSSNRKSRRNSRDRESPTRNWVARQREISEDTPGLNPDCPYFDALGGAISRRTRRCGEPVKSAGSATSGSATTSNPGAIMADTCRDTVPGRRVCRPPSPLGLGV